MSSPTTIAPIQKREVGRPYHPPKFEEKELTKKQALFVEYYLQGNNATKAADLAGYSPFTSQIASSVVLKHPAVQKELRRRAEEAFENKKIDTNWLLMEVQRCAEANILDYVDIKPDGNWDLALNRINREMGTAIQELSFDLNGKPKIKLVEKKGYLELLAKLKRMFGAEEKENNSTVSIQLLDGIIKEGRVVVNQQINVFDNSPSEKKNFFGSPKQNVLEGQESLG